MPTDVQTFELRSDTPLFMTRRRMPDDPELSGGKGILGTYLNGNLIARCVAGDGSEEGELTAQLVYVAQVSFEGIQGVLMACSIMNEADPSFFTLLGAVVRIQSDIKRPNGHPELEAIDHFMTILEQGAVPVVERVIATL